MVIKRLYQRCKKIKRYKKIRPYIELSRESIYRKGFNVELRFPESGHIYLKTGNHCVLDGKYIFEKETGYIQIGNRVHIGSSTFISINKIIIEDDVTIAWDCLFYDHNSHSVDWEKRSKDTEQEYIDIKKGLNPITNKNWAVVNSSPIHICKKAWIGMGVKILKGVTIGEGAIVGAGSVVVKNVAPWTIVGGNPAVELKKL